jgi:hypothetical protein
MPVLQMKPLKPPNMHK